MIVKIIKCDPETVWYSHLIGKSVEVQKSEGRLVYKTSSVIEGFADLLFTVNPDDCEIIEDEKS